MHKNIKTAKKHKNACFLNCYKNIKNIFTSMIYSIDVKNVFTLFTARSCYASAVLGIVILSVCPSHACFVTKRKNIQLKF